MRTCGRTNETVPHPGSSPGYSNAFGGCSSAYFQTHSISYSHVCGRIVGYQFGSPDAFRPYTWYTHIEDPYVDGAILLHGNERQHIWTFSASNSETGDFTIGYVCPCTNAESDQSIPPFVGEDYFCETGRILDGGIDHEFLPNDPLWDGEDCGPGSTCCELNDPPYFCKTLSEPTTDNSDIEVRICGDEGVANEDTPIELIEIFVQ